jgi:hypothetical protein
VKRTLIYAAAAAILLVTFILQESLDSKKNTLAIPSLPGSMDRIILETGETSLKLYAEAQDGAGVKKGGSGGEEATYQGWKVGEEAFPADARKIADLISAAGSLGRADVISAREAYKKFGLDEDNERILRFFADDREVLVLRFGNNASSGSSVYGRIQDHREVVLLPQDLSQQFSTKAEDFREKQMASFSRASIDRMEITSPDQEKILLSKKTVEAPDTGTEAGGGSDGTTSPEAGAGIEAGPETVWTAETTGGTEIKEADESSFRNLFTELADLRAEAFPEKEPEGEPFAALVLYYNGGERAVVSLWPPDDAGSFPVRVSTNRYSFTLPKWRARRLLLGLDRYFDAFEKEE